MEAEQNRSTARLLLNVLGNKNPVIQFAIKNKDGSE